MELWLNCLWSGQILIRIWKYNANDDARARFCWCCSWCVAIAWNYAYTARASGFSMSYQYKHRILPCLTHRLCRGLRLPVGAVFLWVYACYERFESLDTSIRRARTHTNHTLYYTNSIRLKSIINKAQTQRSNVDIEEDLFDGVFLSPSFSVWCYFRWISSYASVRRRHTPIYGCLELFLGSVFGRTAWRSNVKNLLTFCIRLSRYIFGPPKHPIRSQNYHDLRDGRFKTLKRTERIFVKRFS